MSASTSERTNDADGAGVTVSTRVRVYPGTTGEGCGVVVEDFGDTVGYANDPSEQHHTADRAHRWAVMLDAGDLVLVDSGDLVAE